MTLCLCFLTPARKRMASSSVIERPFCSEKQESTPPKREPVVRFIGIPMAKAELPIAHTNTTIFFDWDDTCLTTSWLENMGFKAHCLSGPLEKRFAELGDKLYSIVYPLLFQALSFGRVVIVTNGAEGWIQQSCAIFMPQLLPLISSSSITLISAKARYSHMYTSPMVWKRLTFRDTLDADNRKVGSVRNLISIGDGIAEYYALHSLKTYPCVITDNPSNILKSIKLVNQPTPSTLSSQLSLLQEVLSTIVHHPNSIDINAYIQYTTPPDSRVEGI